MINQNPVLPPNPFDQSVMEAVFGPLGLLLHYYKRFPNGANPAFATAGASNEG
ncbi:hypothetical protein R50073_50330 (plasmid) [Maricurvus nonylphenolicus]